MKELIEEILEEETTARKRVAEAKEEAKRMRLAAEEKARDITAKVQEKVQSECRELIDNARIAAEKEKAKQLEKALKAGETLWDKKKEKVDLTVDSIFGMIAGEKRGIPS